MHPTIFNLIHLMIRGAKHDLKQTEYLDAVLATCLAKKDTSNTKRLNIVFLNGNNSLPYGRK